MDKVIKEGTLRVLISESTCDVILSCKDHRLMAHKLILSIASPVFRELLRKTSADSTAVIIIPDISVSIMSTILDYIYTGTSVVYSNSLQEFLSVARFLQIAVDTRSIESVLESLQKVEHLKNMGEDCRSIKRCKKDSISTNDRVTVENIEYCKMDVKKQDIDCSELAKEITGVADAAVEAGTKSNAVQPESQLSQTKAEKRLPDLLPINSAIFRKSTRRRMCNVVVPSPWCQRSDRRLLGDPRMVTLRSSEKESHKLHIEDTNNNFQLSQNNEIPKSIPKSLDTIIRHLYQSNSAKEQSNKNSTSLGEDYSKKEDLPLPCSDSYQKDFSKAPERPDLSCFPLSRNLATFKQFDSKNRLESVIPVDPSDNSSEIPNVKYTNYKKVRTYSSDYSLESRRGTTSPLNFAQNLSISRKSTDLPQPPPINLPPSTTLTPRSPAILNIPLISPGFLNSEPKNLAKSPVIEPNSNSNDNSNFNDVSNDNSSSEDSSGDEKKEDDINVKKKSYKCDDCGKCFSQLRNYKYHRSVHEGTKEFSAKCSECGKMFNDRGYLSSHMKIHRDRKEYACPNCPKRFNQRVAYNMHLRIHTGVKPHECPTCGKSFSRKMLLKQHQRVHTGERPYTCPECGKTFADRSNMSLHARLHTGVKPYGCNLCPKSFTKKHHLKTHMNFHTGLKPYTCEKCGLAFSQSSNMRTHYKKCILKDSLGKSTKAESISSAENNSS